MTAIQRPDADTLKTWLDSARVEYYLCNECHGLHLPMLQEIDGVAEGRLFQQDWGLVLSAELPIRPTALLPLIAELGPLNAAYGALKLFADVTDDTMPQLVASASTLTGAGLSEEQFALFLATTLDAVTELAAELKQMDFLLSEEPAPASPSGSSSRVH